MKALPTIESGNNTVRNALAIGALAGVALLASGCSLNKQSAGVKPIECTAIDAADWLSVPPGYSPKSVASIARFLNVDPARISNGKVGTARCETALTVEQAGRDDRLAAVRGISSICLVIAVNPGYQLAAPDVSYHKLGLICAEPANAASDPNLST